MKFIDTHAHLYAEQFEPDRSEMILRAINAGVELLFLPNIDSSSIDGMLDLEKEFPKNCYPMMGLHPCSVKANFKEELALVEQWLAKRSFAGIGEMGIDLYWDKTFVEEQKEAFLIQCQWGVDYDLPIIIHSRESTQLCIDLISNLPSSKRPYGVFHCFGGSLEQAKQIKALGFYLGIGGVVSFKKSALIEIMEQNGLDSVVLETDAPYLAPHPHRGKRNESFFIHQIAASIASILQIEIEEVASVTSENAKRLFAKALTVSVL